MHRFVTWVMAVVFFCGFSGVSLAFGEQDAVPKFEDYPAQIYTGPVAPAASDLSDQEQEVAAEVLSEPAMFAGEYVMYGDGCGTGCSTQVLLSKRTGGILHRFVATWGFAEDEDLPVGEKILEMHPDSGLLVTGGIPEDLVEYRADDDGDVPGFRFKDGVQGEYRTTYYVLENGELKQIKTVSKLL